MTQRLLPVQAVLSPAQRDGTTTHLQGPRLVTARIAWITLVALIITTSVRSLPDYFAQLQSVCIHAPCAYGQISQSTLGSLHTLGFSVSSYAVLNLTLALTISFLAWAVSVVVFWRKSDDWMALLVALLLVAGGTLSMVETEVTGHTAWQFPSQVLGLLTFLLYYLVFSLFPNGQFEPRWTRWLLVSFCALIVVFASLFPNPFVLPLSLSVLIALVLFGFYASLAVGQIYRYRRQSDLMRRQQTKWVVYGLTVTSFMIVGGVLPSILFPQSPYPLIYKPLQACTLLLIPLTISIAILRYRLWEIDLIIKRTLVYALLTASTLGFYVVVVFGLSALLRAHNDLFFSFLATVLIAVLFQPLRERLQHGVNRLMFGERNEPYRVLARLGQRLEETFPADKVLPTIVETVAHALKLPYVAIVWGREQTPLGAEPHQLVMAFGTSEGSATEARIPLVHQGKHLGDLMFSPRQRGEDLTPADLRLLRDLAPHIGMALQSALLLTDLQRLTSDLQRSRERLVAAREEERRRLRRDLHDGLGPQLSSQTFTLSAIKKLLRQDPDTAESLLTDAMIHAQEAVTDIRRLVYALRPPALDDLGLLAALQEQINRYDASGIMLTLEAPKELPPLPAAIEMACYRVVQEALTNIVRHSHATSASVHLRVQEGLVVEVTDNGQGFPPGVRRGVGLNSIHERAQELGGTCVVEVMGKGGTRVYVRLPLLVERHQENETTQKGESV